MATRAEFDAAFLARHDAITQQFYAAKSQGQATAALQDLFNKTHGYLSLLHMEDLLAAGIDQDYFLDEARTRLRSQEVADALAGPYALSPEDTQKLRDTWGLVL